MRANLAQWVEIKFEEEFLSFHELFSKCYNIISNILRNIEVKFLVKTKVHGYKNAFSEI